jgi:hypothetical protein
MQHAVMSSPRLLHRLVALICYHKYLALRSCTTVGSAAAAVRVTSQQNSAQKAGIHTLHLIVILHYYCCTYLCILRVLIAPLRRIISAYWSYHPHS